MNRVSMPVDWPAIVQVRVPQQIEVVPANLLGLLHDSLTLTGETLADESQNGIDGVLGEKEVAAEACLRSLTRSEIMSDASQQCILSAGKLLSQAIVQFGPVHAYDPGSDLSPTFEIHEFCHALYL